MRAHDEHELHDLSDRHARLLGLRLRACRWAASARSRALGGTAAARITSSPSHLFGHTLGLFGLQGFFLSGSTYDVGVFTLFLFQMVFMDTAGTIPTGAMAERWKWSSFFVFGFFMSMFVYPIFAQLGLGRRLAVARSARTSASATGTSTSPARRSCTWSAASRRWPARS